MSTDSPQPTKPKEHTDLFRRVFNTPDGTKVLAILEDVCGYHRPGFAPDPHTLAYRTGRRDMLVTIRQILSGS